MSRPLRLLRTLHTSAPRLESLAASSSLTTATPPPPAPAPAKFTPKGRPIPVRPPRAARVTLPSGFPEPPSYPPPAEYFTELDEIERAAGGKPKAHPLWAFFRVPATAKGRVDASAAAPPDLGSVERFDDEAVGIMSGRSWTAVELRQKSFEDLHTLWYVLLRERNLLATQKEERRRLGIQHYGNELLQKRSARVRKSMARIKFVLNERRLALIAAAAPGVGVDDVVVPSALPGMNDPAAAVEALAGAPAPDLSIRQEEHSSAQESLFESAGEDGFETEPKARVSEAHADDVKV